MSMELTAIASYGPVKIGKTYRIIGEGCDWFLVRLHGTVLHVFRWVFEGEPDPSPPQPDLQEYDE